MRLISKAKPEPYNPIPLPELFEPPFEGFNARPVRQYAPEVSGAVLLNTMARRLGWPSFAGKRVLDFGCGVRFTRTIINLAMDVGLYVGMDLRKDAMTWLAEHVADERFQFHALDSGNPYYNPDGPPVPDTLPGPDDMDLACMFSVITHQVPEDAAAIFRVLRTKVRDGGAMYFTAYLGEVDSYGEARELVANLSVYDRDALRAIVEGEGWTVRRIHDPSPFQLSAFVCEAR